MQAALSTLWSFYQKHGVTSKNREARPRRRAGEMSSPGPRWGKNDCGVCVNSVSCATEETREEIEAAFLH